MIFGDIVKKISFSCFVSSWFKCCYNDVGCGVGTQVWAGQKGLKFLLQQQTVFLLTNY